jgi:predicted dithiol-disulfide oxidoreductase (DUF899 family)
LAVSAIARSYARDALDAKRRRMPRMAVEKDYRFEGPNGPVGLLHLFEGPLSADRVVASPASSR